ncbi:MAG: glycosyl hydrolase family 18 protein [Bacilli bacterium]
MKYFYPLLLLIFVLALNGCVNDSEIKIKSISADTSLINDDITVEEFSLDMITLNITMSDDKVVYQTIDSTMISVEDLLKLDEPGPHEITVNYEGHQTTFTIKLNENVEKVNITFLDEEGGVALKVEVIKGSNYTDIPDVPTKDGYIGEWDIIDFTNVTNDLIVKPVYTFNDEEKLNEILDSLDFLYNNLVVNEDIILVNTLEEAIISWSSDEETILSGDGKYKRPYEKQTVNLTATINYKDVIQSRTYQAEVEGYKTLENGIASGYVYRSYDKLSDEFFETMDIIYCAFVLIDVNGGFTGPGSNGNSVSYTNNNALRNMTTYVIPKSKEKGIYAIASLGGGGTVPKETFSIIAASDNLRKKFAENSVKLINEYGFDGVDIDWETPLASEKENFTALMNEIYVAVKANNPNHLVTAAITGGMWQPPRYDLPNSIQYLDFVNVMTYGMTSYSGYYQNALYPSSAFNNSTFGVGRTLNSCSIEESVDVFNDLSVPSSKLIFGLAFYGMRQTNDNGTWSSAGSINYTTIKNTILTNSDYIYVYDSKAQVPYIISKDGKTFISYDDPTSVLAKSKYVLDNNLAGLMFWEYGTDLTGDLVHAMNQGLKNN